MVDKAVLPDFMVGGTSPRTARGLAAFSLIVPVSIPYARAVAAVRRVARSQAALLEEAALTLADRAPHPEEVEAWFHWTEEIEREVIEADAAVQALEDSRRLNPRALAAAKMHPELRVTIDRLDRSLAAERAILLGIGREDRGRGDGLERSFGPELRRAFAVVLDQLAEAVRGFGDLVAAEFGSGKFEEIDEVHARTMDVIQETRAVLTELSLLDIDRREHADLWMLQGSVLAAVEGVLAQLDPEQRERSSEAWLERYRLPNLPLVPPLGKWEARRQRFGTRDLRA